MASAKLASFFLNFCIGRKIVMLFAALFTGWLYVDEFLAALAALYLPLVPQ